MILQLLLGWVAASIVGAACGKTTLDYFALRAGAVRA